MWIEDLRSRYVGPMWARHIFLWSIGMGTGSISEAVYSQNQTQNSKTSMISVSGPKRWLRTEWSLMLIISRRYSPLIPCGKPCRLLIQFNSPIDQVLHILTWMTKLVISDSQIHYPTSKRFLLLNLNSNIM